jgi:sugar/nucleoside kinase (ribokinase family)
MDRPRFDIIGIGNAVVDLIASVDDAFLSRHHQRKGRMALVNQEGIERLQAAMPAGTLQGGGSAANTCAVAARLGARVAFLGKVADDELGAAYRRDLEAAGVHFPTPPLRNGAPTARCLVLVTPDGQRTMSTYLGACVAFGEHDLDEALLRESAILYLEGYLFDPPAAQRAFRRAAALARAAGQRVALSLSDAFCVDRHRAAFRQLVREVDILFANEAEITSLYEENTWEEAAEHARHEVPLAALTLSERGSVVFSRAERHAIRAEPTEVVDTTGAGDAYAAGFLAGLAAGRSLDDCGRLGSIAAAEIISHFGAHPQADLKARAATLH